MKSDLLEELHLSNPWLDDDSVPIGPENYLERQQSNFLQQSTWDKLCTLLIGPRQVGKTTLGYHLCDTLLKADRFQNLIYLNCDLRLIREFLQSPTFIKKLIDHFRLDKTIFFIDEVQRLENPGLLLKSIIDLKLPHKILASGSSQLEIKSKVVEHLTGRHMTGTILPMAYAEYGAITDINSVLLYGAYPQIIIESQQKKELLSSLYQNYINKDLVEFLKVGDVDGFQRLIGLLAHQAGQLVNYQQLATDSSLTVHKLKSYLDILENTYVIHTIKPFVGNKRTELTSNPIIYFVDNGFRNQALNNFTALNNRVDMGLLVENYVLQELLKFKLNHRTDYMINYWRTKSGAEVDFILSTSNWLMPIEVKYKNFDKPTIPKSFRSFIDAYTPEMGIIITKNFTDKIIIDATTIYFIPLDAINQLLKLINSLMPS